MKVSIRREGERVHKPASESSLLSIGSLPKMVSMVQVKIRNLDFNSGFLFGYRVPSTWTMFCCS